MRESKNLCTNYLTKFSNDLDGIWYTVETCSCLNPIVIFVSSIQYLLYIYYIFKGQNLTYAISLIENFNVGF